jgi:hypothetical protein
MATVLQAPNDFGSFNSSFEGSFQRIEPVQPAAQPADSGHDYVDRARDDGPNGNMGLSLDTLARDDGQDKWKTCQDHPAVCIPTNPGTLLHPGSCTPCAFVFRVAEGQVRNRCTNGDSCGWCHHPSHPRTRGRRQKSGGARKQQDETSGVGGTRQQKDETEKNGSETSTRDSWSDRESKAKQAAAWNGTEDRGKSHRSAKDERGNGKGNRAGRDDRAKNNRQRNDRDDRSRNQRFVTPPPPMQSERGLERCNTPEFDEQYACYRAPHGAPDPVYHMPISPNQGPQPGPQDDYIRQPTPILYSCIPVHVAVPTQPAEGMTEWPGYVARDTYGRDTYGRDTYSRDTYVRDTYAPAQYVPDYDYPPRMYQPEVQPYGSQPYMMVPVQAAQWKPNHPLRVENAGLDRSREVIHG